MTEPEFYVRNSCCLLLAGNCLESYRTYCVCVCLCVHSSVCTRFSVCSGWISVDTQLCDSMKQKKEIQTDTQLSGRFPLPESVVFVSNACLNQGWLPSGPGLQLNRWNRVHARTLPGQSSFVCNVYQSVTACVYVYGSSRPLWPQCPQSPPHPPPSPLPRRAESDIRDWFISLPSELITLLQTGGVRLRSDQIRCCGEKPRPPHPIRFVCTHIQNEWEDWRVFRLRWCGPQGGCHKEGQRQRSESWSHTTVASHISWRTDRKVNKIVVQAVYT